MIGLCRGLAYQAYRHFGYSGIAALDDSIAVKFKTFGMVPRNHEYADHVVNIRYYQLLDACKVRMRP